MSLLTQFKLAARAGEIEVAANRSLQQFTNSFDSALADFQRFAADAAVAADGSDADPDGSDADPVFDADTLAEIEMIKADIVARATAALQARLAALAAL